MSEESPSENEAKPSGLKRYSLGNLAKEKNLDLDSMDLEELLALRDEVAAKLPVSALKDIDLEQELVLQFQRNKRLQTEVAQADDVPTNQRAQVSNSVRSGLMELIKLQQAVYNAEQCRKMEAALAKALRTLPEEAQRVFYDAYQREADKLATVREVLSDS